MKINTIGSMPVFNNAVYNKKLYINSSSIQEVNQNRNLELPSYGFYNAVSFTGGKSMDLAATKKQLDLYGKYPEHIRDEIEKVLEKGNPDNLTLIDIHLSQYALLEECETLEEAKELYPEFKDVKSDKAIKYNKGSLLDKIKKGEIPAFDKDKDTALQLLQLYWGKGFSLPSLENDYAENNNIYGLFTKLNIPRVDKIYGQYLKLSDKEYNARYAQELSDRLTGRKHTSRKGAPLSIEHRQNISDGLKAHYAEHPMTDEHKEAVSDGLLEYFQNNPAPEERRQKISDGLKAFYAEHPMTDEQKQAVSEGLIEYYQEHPERITEQSELRKKFFEQNPEEKEKFSQVMLRAWSYPKAKSIRKAMSEFMGRKDTISSDEMLQMITEGSGRNFKGFWKEHEWAKDVLSKCVKMSWARQKELSKTGLIYEPLYTCDVMPKGLKGKVSAALSSEIPDFELISQYRASDTRENVIGRIVNLRQCVNLLCTVWDFLKNTDSDAAYRWEFAVFRGVEKTFKSDAEYAVYGDLVLPLRNTEDITSPSFITSLISILEEGVSNNDYDFLRKLDRNINIEYDRVKDKNNEKFIQYIKHHQKLKRM